MCRQNLVDLWASTVHQNNFDTKAMQQCEIADDISEIFIGNRFTAEHDHHGFTTVSVNIGSRLSKSFNESCTANFHSESTLVFKYVQIMTFYSRIGKWFFEFGAIIQSPILSLI